MGCFRAHYLRKSAKQARIHTVLFIHLFTINNKYCENTYIIVSLLIGPVPSCRISTPRGAYSTAAMWRLVLVVQQLQSLEDKVHYPKTHHWYHDVPTLRRKKHVISLKILHLTSLELARQVSANTKTLRHVPYNIFHKARYLICMYATCFTNVSYVWVK